MTHTDTATWELRENTGGHRAGGLRVVKLSSLTVSQSQWSGRTWGLQAAGQAPSHYFSPLLQHMTIISREQSSTVPTFLIDISPALIIWLTSLQNSFKFSTLAPVVPGHQLIKLLTGISVLTHIFYFLILQMQINFKLQLIANQSFRNWVINFTWMSLSLYILVFFLKFFNINILFDTTVSYK